MARTTRPRHAATSDQEMLLTEDAAAHERVTTNPHQDAQPPRAKARRKRMAVTRPRHDVADRSHAHHDVKRRTRHLPVALLEQMRPSHRHQLTATLVAGPLPTPSELAVLAAPDPHDEDLGRLYETEAVAAVVPDRHDVAVVVQVTVDAALGPAVGVGALHHRLVTDAVAIDRQTHRHQSLDAVAAAVQVRVRVHHVLQRRNPRRRDYQPWHNQVNQPLTKRSRQWTSTNHALVYSPQMSSLMT